MEHSDLGEKAMIQPTRNVRAEPFVSVVVPVYCEEKVLPQLFERLESCLNNFAAGGEVWLVDDGSSDESRELITKQTQKDARFRSIFLSRNFGHTVAVTAGLDMAEGDAVVVMDADLQDPPELIASMKELYCQGYDVVHAKRRRRAKESLFKRFTAATYYRLHRAITGIDMPFDVGEFRLMSRPVVLALRKLREQHRLVRGLVAWVGFSQTTLEFDRPARAAGSTKYTFRKMLALGLDGLTSFSVLPLRVALFVGFLAMLFGVVYAAHAIYVGWYLGLGVPGWTSLVILQIFFSACILICLGVVGEYVGKVFEQTKCRPLYFVKPLEPKKRELHSLKQNEPVSESMKESTEDAH